MHVRTAITTLLLVALTASPARAQEPSASEIALGRDQLRVGLEHARAERWTEARTAFARAYELTHRPAILINLATAQEALGQLVDASESLHHFLRDDREGGDRRASVDTELASIEGRIPHARLDVSGLQPGDEVRLDTAVLSRAALGSALPVDPGAHALVVMRNGAEVGRRSFEVAESASADVTLELTAPSVAAAEPAPPPPASTTLPPAAVVLDPHASEPAPAASSGGGLDDGAIAAIVVLSVLVVGAGVGVGLGFALQPQAPQPFDGNLGHWAVP